MYERNCCVNEIEEKESPIFCLCNNCYELLFRVGGLVPAIKLGAKCVR